MNVSTQSKRRATRAPLYRIQYEPDHDHPAWEGEGPAPTPRTDPDAFYAVQVLLRPPKTRLERRRPHESLSITALRKRLYGAGVRGSRVADIAREIKEGSKSLSGFTGGLVVMGWPVTELKQRYGSRVARAVMRFVKTKLLMMDEAHFFFNNSEASGLIQEAMQRYTKINSATFTNTQSASQLVGVN